MKDTAASAPTAEELRGLFAADYVEVTVAPDGTVHPADEADVDVATQSLKRERTWFASCA